MPGPADDFDSLDLRLGGPNDPGALPVAAPVAAASSVVTAAPAAAPVVSAELDLTLGGPNDKPAKPWKLDTSSMAGRMLVPRGVSVEGPGIGGSSAVDAAAPVPDSPWASGATELHGPTVSDGEAEHRVSVDARFGPKDADQRERLAALERVRPEVKTSAFERLRASEDVQRDPRVGTTNSDGNLVVGSAREPVEVPPTDARIAEMIQGRVDESNERRAELRGRLHRQSRNVVERLQGAEDELSPIDATMSVAYRKRSGALSEPDLQERVGHAMLSPIFVGHGIANGIYHVWQQLADGKVTKDLDGAPAGADNYFLGLGETLAEGPAALVSSVGRAAERFVGDAGERGLTAATNRALGLDQAEHSNMWTGDSAVKAEGPVEFAGKALGNVVPGLGNVALSAFQMGRLGLEGIGGLGDRTRRIDERADSAVEEGAGLAGGFVGSVAHTFLDPAAAFEEDPVMALVNAHMVSKAVKPVAKWATGGRGEGVLEAESGLLDAKRERDTVDRRLSDATAAEDPLLLERSVAGHALERGLARLEVAEERGSSGLVSLLEADVASLRARYELAVEAYRAWAESALGEDGTLASMERQAAELTQKANEARRTVERSKLAKGIVETVSAIPSAVASMGVTPLLDVVGSLIRRRLMRPGSAGLRWYLLAKDHLSIAASRAWNVTNDVRVRAAQASADQAGFILQEARKNASALREAANRAEIGWDGGAGRVARAQRALVRASDALGEVDAEAVVERRAALERRAVHLRRVVADGKVAVDAEGVERRTEWLAKVGEQLWNDPDYAEPEAIRARVSELAERQAVEERLALRHNRAPRRLTYDGAPEGAEAVDRAFLEELDSTTDSPWAEAAAQAALELAEVERKLGEPDVAPVEPGAVVHAARVLAEDARAELQAALDAVEEADPAARRGAAEVAPDAWLDEALAAAEAAEAAEAVAREAFVEASRRAASSAPAFGEVGVLPAEFLDLKRERDAALTRDAFAIAEEVRAIPEALRPLIRQFLHQEHAPYFVSGNGARGALIEWSDRGGGGWRVTREGRAAAVADPGMAARLLGDVDSANRYGRPLALRVREVTRKAVDLGMFDDPATIRKLYWPQMGISLTDEIRAATEGTGAGASVMREAGDLELLDSYGWRRANRARRAGVPIEVRESDLGMSMSLEQEALVGLANFSADVHEFELKRGAARNPRLSVSADELSRMPPAEQGRWHEAPHELRFGERLPGTELEDAGERVRHRRTAAAAAKARADKAWDEFRQAEKLARDARWDSTGRGGDGPEAVVIDARRKLGLTAEQVAEGDAELRRLTMEADAWQLDEDARDLGAPGTWDEGGRDAEARELYTARKELRRAEGIEGITSGGDKFVPGGKDGGFPRAFGANVSKIDAAEWVRQALEMEEQGRAGTRPGSVTRERSRTSIAGERAGAGGGSKGTPEVVVRRATPAVASADVAALERLTPYERALVEARAAVFRAWFGVKQAWKEHSQSGGEPGEIMERDLSMYQARMSVADARARLRQLEVEGAVGYEERQFRVATAFERLQFAQRAWIAAGGDTPWADRVSSGTIEAYEAVKAAQKALGDAVSTLAQVEESRRLARAAAADGLQGAERGAAERARLAASEADADWGAAQDAVWWAEREVDRVVAKHAEIQKQVNADQYARDKALGAFPEGDVNGLGLGRRRLHDPAPVVIEAERAAAVAEFRAREAQASSDVAAGLERRAVEELERTKVEALKRARAGATVWGDLTGRFVHEDVYFDLANARILRDEMGTWFFRTMSTIKRFKTAGSFTTHVRNIITNFALLAPMAGLSPLNPANLLWMGRAAKLMWEGGAEYAKAAEHGVFNGQQLDADTVRGFAGRLLAGQVFESPVKWTERAFRLIGELSSKDKAAAEWGDKGLTWAAKGGQVLWNATKEVFWTIPGKVYNAEDAVFRFALFLKEVDAGVRAAIADGTYSDATLKAIRDKAGARAAEAFADYDRVNGLVQTARTGVTPLALDGMMRSKNSAAVQFGFMLFGQPFIAYPSVVVPLMQRWLAADPVRAGVWLGVHRHMSDVGYAEAGVTREQLQAERKLLPEFEQAYTPLVEVIGRDGVDSTGRTGWYNVDFMNPVGKYRWQRSPGDRTWDTARRWLTNSGVGNSMFLGPFVDVVRNRRNYGGQTSFYGESDTDVTYDVLSLLVDAYLPPTVPSFESVFPVGRDDHLGPGGMRPGLQWAKMEAGARGLPDQRGRSRTLMGAAADVLGAAKTDWHAPNDLVLGTAYAVERLREDAEELAERETGVKSARSFLRPDQVSERNRRVMLAMRGVLGEVREVHRSLRVTMGYQGARDSVRILDVVLRRIDSWQYDAAYEAYGEWQHAIRGTLGASEQLQRAEIDRGLSRGEP